MFCASAPALDPGVPTSIQERPVISLSVVIPAYNEQDNIPSTLDSIPVDELRAAGVTVEILVVDNGSTDATGRLAAERGARVLVQPVRGYGNAYKAGFANCLGDVIATGDADRTYPFEILPEALALFQAERLDFLSTNRLGALRPDAMTRSHVWGNRALSTMTRLLFDLPFRDSQSGMWIFRRQVWTGSRVLSGGMAFSQELKIEAYRNGFRCGELPIDYRPRGGEKKLRTVRDGALNASQMLAHLARASQPLPTYMLHIGPGRLGWRTPTRMPVGAPATVDRSALRPNIQSESVA
jgi:glycosyltransferase involved in cell wall biosynthesis